MLPQFLFLLIASTIECSFVNLCNFGNFNSVNQQNYLIVQRSGKMCAILAKDKLLLTPGYVAYVFGDDGTLKKQATKTISFTLSKNDNILLVLGNELTPEELSIALKCLKDPNCKSEKPIFGTSYASS